MPFTGRSRTDGQIVSSHEAREMRKDVLQLTVNRSRWVTILTTGELPDMETVTSSPGRGGWRSVGNDDSLATYSTSPSVREWRRGERPPRRGGSFEILDFPSQLCYTERRWLVG